MSENGYENVYRRYIMRLSHDGERQSVRVWPAETDDSFLVTRERMIRTSKLFEPSKLKLVLDDWEGCTGCNAAHIFASFDFEKSFVTPRSSPRVFNLNGFLIFLSQSDHRDSSTNQRLRINLKTSLCKMGCCTFCMFQSQQREQHDLHQLDHFYNLRTNKLLLYKIGNLQQPTQIVITSYYDYLLRIGYKA